MKRVMTKLDIFLPVADGDGFNVPSVGWNNLSP
jgi:hypothetical protein